MTNDQRSLFRARVESAARIEQARVVALAAADANQASLDRLIAQLEHAAGDNRADVEALVAQYRAGTLTLTDLVTQAHQLAQDASDDAADDAGDGKPVKHSMLTISALLGVLGGLSVIGHSNDQMTRTQGDGLLKTLQRTAVQQGAAVGAAEAGGSVDVKRVTKAFKSVDERVRAIIDKLNAGTVSGPQAANQIQTIIGGDAWLQYQHGKTSAAPDDATWDWDLDPEAAHCEDPDGQDCPTFADGGPYATADLPAHPADGTTPCVGACKCNLKRADTGKES